MAKEEVKAVGEWALKDALILIPFLASALALTWEVGFFVRIKGGAFGLFSISEHLTFALQAVPIALLFTVLIVLVALWDSNSTASFPLRLFPLRLFPSWKWRVFFICICVPIVALVFSLLAQYFGVRVFSQSEPGDIMFTAGMLIAALTLFGLFNAEKSVFVGFLCVLCGFFLAFGIGVQNARSEIRSKRPLNTITIGEKGKAGASDIKVRIMRSGERGVLYFDPQTRRFGLVPWDSIKQIDWELSSLIP
jgi:hypothetical protein